MTSKISRSKKLESTVSICLLGILMVIAVGIYIKQSNVDMSRFGADTAALTLSTGFIIDSDEPVEFDLASLAPIDF